MIRPATMEDLRPVVGMILDHYAAIQGTRFPDAEDVALYLKDFCESCIEDPGRFCAVAEEDGHLAGMLTGIIAPGFAFYPHYLVAHEVSTWVKPEVRRNGYGKGLVRSFFDWAQQHPLEPKMVLAGVYQHMAPKETGHLYRGCGFALESQVFSRRIRPCRR